MASTTLTLEFDKVMIALKKEVQDIMHNSTDDFKKVVSAEVHRSVYPYYRETLEYGRRKDDGGLSDTDNYDVVEGDLSLTLTNNTRSNPNYWRYRYSIPITEVVEEGSGYGWQDVPPRPFMDKALDKFAHDVLEPKITALGGD